MYNLLGRMERGQVVRRFTHKQKFSFYPKDRPHQVCVLRLYFWWVVDRLGRTVSSLE